MNWHPYRHGLFGLCLAIAMMFGCASDAAGWSREQTYSMIQTAIDGNMAKPVMPGPRESLYPRSAPPAETIHVFDATGLDNKTKILVNTLQGLANRGVPELYVLYQKPGETANEAEDLSINHDRRWLDWLLEHDYLGRTESIDTLPALLERYGIERVIQVDPDFQASLNLATMIAGIEGLAVAYPEQVEQYGLEVAMDLKGRWQTNAEAYQWAFDELWPQMTHDVIAVLGPTPNLSHVRDYLVAEKVFTFWVSGEKENAAAHADVVAELDVMAGILGRMPVNIPVLGYPWAGSGVGIGEGGGVRLISAYGKWLVPTDWKTNLTLWTGLESKLDHYEHKPAPSVALEQDKVYISYIVSDGDNLNTWYDYFPKYWGHESRGSIPFGWAMGPSLIDMQAPVVDYYYTTLSDADSFGAAVCGIGYMYPAWFARGYGDEASQDAVWAQFMDLTAEYMRKLDMEWVWLMNYGPVKGEPVLRYAGAPGVIRTVFPGYGDSTPYDRANYIAEDVAYFHSVTGRQDAEDMIRLLPTITEQRPAFMHVFLHNWKYPSFDEVETLTQGLPGDFVVVRPEELARLFRLHQARQ